MSVRAGAVVPPGYTRFSVGDADVVGLTRLETALREALREGSFYDYAAHHPGARQLVGRGIAFAVPLPDDAARVVVRRSRHGGVLAPITGERFLGATRAPRELEVALRLTRLGVPTPEIVAFATYPAGPAVRRADVLTREVEGSVDLASALADADERAKRALLAAVAKLMASLAAAGARHPDLNIKNVLVARDANGEPEALLLDVDRVWFDTPGSPRVNEANLRRFDRSARKWRRTRALPIQEPDLRWLAATVSELATAAGAS
jgi:Lipopolysaccharide kinase (Kdo/WaaP) family